MRSQKRDKLQPDGPLGSNKEITLSANSFLQPDGPLGSNKEITLSANSFQLAGGDKGILSLKHKVELPL